MKANVNLSRPDSHDGYEVNQLVKRCKPLDENSTYCNLLQCDHFADTSVIARQNNEVVGFVSGYRVPERPDVLFVWQVAVDDRMRGSGLATNMLQHLLSRIEPDFIETTITADNQASWALFSRFAERNGSELSHEDYYLNQTHFKGQHDSEKLVRIGPIKLQ
ncbi:MAG: diaminobutyrate acetyltransferase [Reinekea sp.]|jgi:diaminobutyrate acetyltransferase